jgi:hypothetical protein
LEQNAGTLASVENAAAVRVQPKPDVLNPTPARHTNRDKVTRFRNWLPMGCNFALGVLEHSGKPALFNARIGAKLNAAPGQIDEPQQAPAIERIRATSARNPRLAHQAHAKGYILTFQSGGKRGLE